MIEEAYVSFETAKLLKEKGFDELCNKKYDGYKRIVPAGKMIELWQNSELDDECSAPTQQMAMRWLREIHNIVIIVQPVVGKIGFTWEYRIIKFHAGKGYGSINGTEFIKYGFYSYEEATETAIKCCLENLIGYES